MKPVTESQVTRNQHHAGMFITEASTIGLAPGYWPREIPTVLGNGSPFLRDYETDSGNAVVYFQNKTMCSLTVFND